MGFLYVKVIESKKVAVRSSFFVNYPFIRLIIGKEKRNTGFKPGVEWWDKIYSFQNVSCDEDLVMYAQARDKSIHVFGSDWLGEVPIKVKPLMDGKVHQLWFRLGKGRKQHSRSPRGYVHLAVQYFHEPPHGIRPFSQPPVEPIMAFEDWLATQDRNEYKIFSASTSSVNPTPSKSSEAERLRQSAPSENGRPRSISSPPIQKRAAPLGSKPKSKSSVSFKNTPETIHGRGRSNTLPTDVQSPRRARRSALKVSAQSDESDASSDASESEGVVKTANLIDLSYFDIPNAKTTGRHYDAGEIFNKESPVTWSPKNQTSTFAAASTTTLPPTTSSVVNHNPTFADWYKGPTTSTTTELPERNSYNPANPFLAMHEANAPSYTVKN